MDAFIVSPQERAALVKKRRVERKERLEPIKAERAAQGVWLPINDVFAAMGESRGTDNGD